MKRRSTLATIMWLFVIALGFACPNRALSQANAGWITLFDGSNLDKPGLASAKKAVTLQPTLAPAHSVLAKLQLQAGRYADAIEQCRRALALDANDQTSLYRLIQALRKSGDKSEIPELLKRLAAVREQAAKEERERYRYKLVLGGPASTSSSP